MKQVTTRLLLAAIGLMAAFPAQAERDAYSIRDRMEQQQAVIQRGIESGTLSRRDVLTLQREQREIRELADDLRRSGTSRYDRQRILDAKLDRADRHIREAMRKDRYGHGRPGYDDRREYDNRYRQDRPGDAGVPEQYPWGR